MEACDARVKPPVEKRPRKVNFTNVEITTMLEEIAENKEVIQSKFQTLIMHRPCEGGKGVAQASNTVTTSMLDDAARVVRRVYCERDPSLPADGVIDLTVSYEGSWMTRGHRSLYGIG